MSLFTVERSSQSSPVESSSEDGESSDNRSRCSSVDGFWTSKNIAIFLPTQKLWNSVKQSNSGPISEHLQKLILLLRPNDRCSLAVELESPAPSVSRYLAIISFVGVHEHEECICLGVEYQAKTARVTLVVPIYRDTSVKLSGDGRFTLTVGQYFYTFKPVSVQCMWATIQKLHETIHCASANNYYHGGLSHTWTSYYQSRLTSDQRTLRDWAFTEDSTTRPDSPGMSRTSDREDPLKIRIVNTLRAVMQTVDLECATSKEIRNLCEEKLKLDLKDYRGFIDQQTLSIFGQMELSSEIFDFLYLGSEWNASNFKEMQEKGIGYVLNVTCEIDNFFPDSFHYYNIRVWDTSETDLLKHWDDTYQFIKKAQANNSKVLVHCKMGVSRSASTVIAFAMKEYKWQLKEALDYVRKRRECVNPNCGFIQQLRQYEGILGARHNPVWGEKATLRKRVTEIPGPSPPASCRVSSASEDLMVDIPGMGSCHDADADDDDDDVAAAAGADGSKAFVRTSSVSRLRLSSQRPKSWAGTKREEELMKEQNISLYFKSLMSEQQQVPDELATCAVEVRGAAAAAATSKRHHLTTGTCPVSHADSTSASAATARATSPAGAEFAPGHRRASSAKSWDPTAAFSRHGAGQTAGTGGMTTSLSSSSALGMTATAAAAAAGGDGSSCTLATTSTRPHSQQLLATSATAPAAASAAGPHSPIEDSSHTPVADRQPSAQQIESELGSRLRQELPADRLDTLSQRTTSVGSECSSSPGDVPADVEMAAHAGNSDTRSESPTLTADRVRQQVASFESRTSSDDVTPTQRRLSSSADTVQQAGQVTPAGLRTISPTASPARVANSGAASSGPVSPTPPQAMSPTPPATTASALATTATPPLPGTPVKDDTTSSVTVVETPNIGPVRRVRVEERPQISSVHHRVQSIERFKIFTPQETRQVSHTAATDKSDPATSSTDPAAAAAVDDVAAAYDESYVAVAQTIAMSTEAQSTVDTVPNIERAASPLLPPNCRSSSSSLSSQERTEQCSSGHVQESHQQQESESLSPSEDLPNNTTEQPLNHPESPPQQQQRQQHGGGERPSTPTECPVGVAEAGSSCEAPPPQPPPASSSPERDNTRTTAVPTPSCSDTSGSSGSGSSNTTSSASTGTAVSSTADKPTFSFAGFHADTSTAAAAATEKAHTAGGKQSPRMRSSGSSRTAGSRSMSVSSGGGNSGRRARAPYSWLNKRGESSPSHSPPLRRGDHHSSGSPSSSIMASRSSPQLNRGSRFTFLSPRSQRRSIMSSSPSEENFVTYIPTRRNTGGADMKQTQHFQSLLDRFKEMSKPKMKSPVSEAEAATTAADDADCAFPSSGSPGLVSPASTIPIPIDTSVGSRQQAQQQQAQSVPTVLEA